jgi:hypothetical protein
VISLSKIRNVAHTVMMVFASTTLTVFPTPLCMRKMPSMALKSSLSRIRVANPVIGVIESKLPNGSLLGGLWIGLDHVGLRCANPTTATLRVHGFPVKPGMTGD